MEAGTDDDETAIPPRENCLYTSCFCEENVWMLCDHVHRHQLQQLDKCYTVFISNPNKAVPIWNQRNSKEIGKPVVWDYHVIMLRQDSGDTQVYDLDTRLPFPSDFTSYVKQSFGADYCLKSDFHRLFRVVPASQFICTFASDRSHMKKDDGSWIEVPPVYPCICTKESTNNLNDFVSMDPAIGWGKVMDLKEFSETFGHEGLFEQLLPLLKF